MPATIKDVAKIAGCSIKTVSRVINHEPYVTEDTRQKVQSAILAVQYTPNISARRLAHNRSYTICLLISPGYDQDASIFFSTALELEAGSQYDVLSLPYSPSSSIFRKKITSLVSEQGLDGVVTTPPADVDDFVADLFIANKIPQVQINPLKRSDQIPYIACDDYQGAYRMTEYLIGLGHRRISFLRGPANFRASIDRFYGYRAALDSNQRMFDETLLRESGWTFDGGYSAAKELLKDPKTTPSAIFAGSDQAAFGVIYAAQEMNIRIPEDISISGYGDLPISKFIWPGLTTVHQSVDATVELAAHTLIDLINEKLNIDRTKIIPSTLVVRGSTRNPAV